MKNKVYPDFDTAVADVPDGITFMSPGKTKYFHMHNASATQDGWHGRNI